MKKIAFTFAIAFMAKSLQAQSPVITSANAYLVGDETEIAWCSNPTEPGDAGENVTWDFSNLAEIEEQVFEYVDPASTLWDYQFPESNLCGVGQDGYHSYYRVTDDFLIIEGYAQFSDDSPLDTFKLVYDDVEELIPFPLEYGDTHFDTFEGTTQALGFAVTFDGEIDFEADGYGTLILPNGTFENVIRYHFSRTQVNTVLGQSSTVTKEQWGWMSADHRFWLCLMETNNDGFGNEDIVWYAKNPLLLSNQEAEVQRISVFPNPKRSGEPVFFDSDTEGRGLVRVFSIDGRLIESFPQQLFTGRNPLEFRSDLPSGIYTLTIQLDNQNLASKLIVN